jgi:hypothetical protein
MTSFLSISTFHFITSTNSTSQAPIPYKHLPSSYPIQTPNIPSTLHVLQLSSGDPKESIQFVIIFIIRAYGEELLALNPTPKGDKVIFNLKVTTPIYIVNDV